MLNLRKLTFTIAFLTAIAATPASATFDCSKLFERWGWKPVKIGNLPKDLMEVSELQAFLPFLEKFGSWRYADGKWRAYRYPPGQRPSLENNNTSVAIDLRTQRVSFWLENSAFFTAMKANVRRVAWAVAAVSYEGYNVALPKTKVAGMNGISVLDLPLEQKSVRLLAKLQRSVSGDQKAFQWPLEAKAFHRGFDREVEAWLLRKLNQSDVTDVIRIDDIIR